MGHEAEWAEDDDCAVCGARYHCGQCNEGTGMMAHYISDGKDGFFSCVDGEAYAAWRDRQRMERELEELSELRRLKAKYETHAG